MSTENRYLAIALLSFLALLLFLFKVNFAHARNLDGRYDNAPNKEWYESQHNSLGQWCCNESDGHPYEGDYAINKDGSVTVYDNGKPYTIESFKVLTGPNPTGHAVWWFLEGNSGKTTYCFAPGAGT